MTEHPVGLARLSARALFYGQRGDVQAAAQAHRQVIDLVETNRAAYRGTTPIDTFDRRHNRRFEEAIQFFLDTGQPEAALELIDRSRFRSGCEALERQLGIQLAPASISAWQEQCVPGELVLAEWLQAPDEWSISFSRDLDPQLHCFAAASDPQDTKHSGEGSLPWLPDFELARQRLQRLLDAHAETLDDYRRLRIVPHGQQWRAPWAALQHPRTGRPLHESHELVLSTSLRWSSIHQQSTVGEHGRSLVIGDPGGDEPWAEIEARQVSELLDTTPLMGADATCAAVRQALASHEYDVIHFAGHGSFDGTDQSALQLADGRLTAQDLHGLDIRANLVYLASCWSAVTRFSVWNELHGFPRAVLEAGARSMVACSFPLSARAGPLVASEFYRSYAPGSAARALRTALASLPAEAPVHSWGSLFVVGDP